MNEIKKTLDELPKGKKWRIIWSVVGAVILLAIIIAVAV